MTLVDEATQVDIRQTPQQNAKIVDIVAITRGTVERVIVTATDATAYVNDGQGDVEYRVRIARDGAVTAWDQRFTESGLESLRKDGCNPAGLGDWYDSFGFGTSELLISAA